MSLVLKRLLALTDGRASRRCAASLISFVVPVALLY